MQQKQGRVRAIAQLHGHGLNDSAVLEREADVMGVKALAGSGPAGATVEQSEALSNAGAPIQRVEVARIMDVDKDASFLSPAAQKSPDLQAKKYAEIVGMIKQDDPGLIHILEAHAQGDTDADSPFISVARNVVSLSYSTDDSHKGVEAILRGAPHLAFFDVPDLGEDGVWLLPAMSELSLGETELLVLLPGGVSLKKYLKPPDDKDPIPGVLKNPYMGMTLEARDAYNRRHGLERTKFLLSEEEGLKEVPYEQPSVKPKAATSSAVTEADLTPGEIDFLLGRIAEALSTTVEKLKTWKASELAQYLNPEKKGYLEFVNANPDKRKK